jgi:putative membrane protein
VVDRLHRRQGQQADAGLNGPHWRSALATREHDEKADLAEERTGLAEDRTMLANERTFASWTRTGMASIAVGLGFNALFPLLSPAWLPRLIASIFLCLAILIFVAAERAACSVAATLHPHHVKPLRVKMLRMISWGAILATALLIGGLWLFYFQS